MWNMPDRKGVGNGDYRRFVFAWGGCHPDEHRNSLADGAATLTRHLWLLRLGQ